MCSGCCLLLLWAPGWASGGFDDLEVRNILAGGSREAEGLGEMLVGAEL